MTQTPGNYGPTQSGNYGPPQGGGYGPPNQGYGPPQGQWGPPPPQKKSHKVRNAILGIIGAIILIVIIANAASSGGSKDDTTAKKTTDKADTGKGNSKSTTSSTDHSEDVQITSCSKDSSTGFPTAKVKVTNNSSKSSNYIVTVSFNSGSEQLDTGLATINNLNPGSSSTQDATSLKTDAPSTFTCKVEDTTRLSAVG